MHKTIRDADDYCHELFKRTALHLEGEDLMVDFCQSRAISCFINDSRLPQEVFIYY